MRTFKVYISASTQSKNIGVGQYGTEQDRMMELADRVAHWLKTQSGIEVCRNQPGWTLSQTVNDCTKNNCELFIDNHTNAGPKKDVVDGKGAEGTEVFHVSNSVGGKKIADLLYSYIAPTSPGGDRGSKPHDWLFVLNHTKCSSALVEHLFYTNKAEVADMLVNMDRYAKAEAQAVCYYFGVSWVEPPDSSIMGLVGRMRDAGLITDTAYWLKVLMGVLPADPSHLKTVFARAVK